MLVKLLKGWRGKGETVEGEHIDIEGHVRFGPPDQVSEGDAVRITAGPFASMEATEGTLTRVDPRSTTYPFTIIVLGPTGESLEIPAARWEFRKI